MRTLAICLVVLVGMAMVFPFVYMICISFMEMNEVFTIPPKIIPNQLQLKNYAALFRTLPFGRFFLNSVIQVLCVTVGRLLIVMPSGYAFSRLKFPGRDKVFMLFISTMMIPGAVTLIPNFMLLHRLGWLDTYWALTIPMFNYAYGVFLVRQYLSTLPDSLEEAAELDGASELQIFTRICLPVAKPIIAVIVIFTFTEIWKQYLWPLIVTRTLQMRPLEVGIALLASEQYYNFPLQMAGATLVSLPPIVIFFLFQRQFIEGINIAGAQH